MYNVPIPSSSIVDRRIMQSVELVRIEETSASFFRLTAARSILAPFNILTVGKAVKPGGREKSLSRGQQSK
jgi:hypothetical protein